MIQQGEISAAIDATRSRPKLPEDYGVPTNEDGLLTWDWVVERLEKARNYWVSTTRPDGRPHVMPVWAVWLDGTLYFDGHPQTRWARNIAQNPNVAIHLESGDEVVILEGVVQDIPHLDPAIAEQLVTSSNAKYNYSTPAEELVKRGLFALRPQAALAWGEFPRTMTRWRFRTS
ncbi:MAG TPA: pyridoxamine 5'-phosphate oxidase family protein [Chloroflexia bacterium]|nr:pyridoxamine 5'-phosphate oxidase family protein [Chloroflexia bacterium]